MTACVNNQNENKGGVSHKVLRSVVAGAMAVSMVPSVALADTVVTESEVAPLANQDDVAAFAAGKVTKAVDGEGNALTVDEDGVITLTATGENMTPEAQTVIPTELELPNGTLVDLTEETVAGTCDYTVSSAKKSDPSTPVNIAGVGNYIVKVAKTGTSLVNTTLEVKVVGASLEDAYAYVGNEVNDSGIVWNGDQVGSFKFAIGDEDVTNGIRSVEFIGRGQTYTGTAVAPAGTYEVDLVGKNGTIYEGSKATVEVTIDKLNLDDLTFSANDIQSSDSGNVPVDVTWLNEDGENFTMPNGAVEYTVYNSDGEKVGPANLGKKKGDYTVEVSVADGYEDSVIGTAEDGFRIVKTLYSTFKYGNKTIDDNLDLFFTQANVAAKNGFSESNIKATTAAGTPEIGNDQMEIVVEKDGKVVTSYDAIGTYVVKVNVKTDATTYDQGGSCTFSFDVVKDKFTNVKTYVEFDGNIVGDSFAHKYDGTDVIEGTSIVVKDSKGVELEAGTDYSVTWYEDENSNDLVDEGEKEVSEVVNFGSYVLVIEGINYSGKDVVAVDVQKCDPTAVRVAGLKTVYQNDGKGGFKSVTGLPYTGEEIVPTFEYTVDTQAEIDKGTAEWKALPVEAYTLVIEKGGKEVVCKAAQEYHANITSTDEGMGLNFDLADYGQNFIGGSQYDGNFFVIDDTYFNDVKAIDWYAVATSTAGKLGYFTGVEGGLFLPTKSLTRAEAVQLMLAMSGEQIDWSNVAKYKQSAAEFGDVDVDAWYAVQLGWAKEAGLVSGDDQGNFNPGQQINREQFAVMLANYASKFGTYEAADLKVLDDYADADSISSWAEAAVAWAVENEVMGANDTLTPQATISRAETATMVVNYQPEVR